LLVFADEFAEDGSALDSLGLGGERDHVGVVVRGAKRQAVALVAASGVVMLDEFVQDEAQMAVGRR
jgi:hypothetical protein